MNYLFLALLISQTGQPAAAQPADITAGATASPGATTIDKPAIDASSKAQSVSVTTLDNQQLVGSLQALDSQQLVIRSAQQPTPIPLRNLMTVQFGDGSQEPSADASVWIRLTGGSRIAATQFTLADGIASIQLGDQLLKVTAKLVRAVRFRPPSERLDPQWEELIAAESAADLMVLRRDDSALDQLEGLINGVDPTTIDFELEGERIPVKRTKPEGIVLFQPRGQTFPEPQCTVYEVGGTYWQVKSARLRDQSIDIETTCGFNYSIPLDQVAQLDFASGNVVFLSDLEPESVEWSPYIASSSTEDLLARLYLPRRDRAFDGDELWIGQGRHTVKYSKGLAIHSRTQLVYRLTQNYRRLTALAGIDSRLRGSGHVLLVIMGDNQELFRQPISGKDPPLPIDLDIDGLDRLTIIVDFGEHADLGDHLNLCDARILK